MQAGAAAAAAVAVHVPLAMSPRPQARSSAQGAVGWISVRRSTPPGGSAAASLPAQPRQVGAFPRAVEVALPPSEGEPLLQQPPPQHEEQPANATASSAQPPAAAAPAKRLTGAGRSGQHQRQRGAGAALAREQAAAELGSGAQPAAADQPHAHVPLAADAADADTATPRPRGAAPGPGRVTKRVARAAQAAFGKARRRQLQAAGWSAQQRKAHDLRAEWQQLPPEHKAAWQAQADALIAARENGGAVFNEEHKQGWQAHAHNGCRTALSPRPPRSPAQPSFRALVSAEMHAAANAAAHGAAIAEAAGSGGCSPPPDADTHFGAARAATKTAWAAPLSWAASAVPLLPAVAPACSGPAAAPTALPWLLQPALQLRTGSEQIEDLDDTQR